MFFQPNELMVGVDIGTSKIAAVLGDVDDHGQLRIKATATVPLPPDSVKYGQVLNVENVMRGLKSVIEQISEKAHVDISEVVLSINDYKMECQVISTSSNIMNEDDLIKQTDCLNLRASAKKLHNHVGFMPAWVSPIGYTINHDSSMVFNPIGRAGSYLQGTFSVTAYQYQTITSLSTVLSKAAYHNALPRTFIPTTLATAATVLTAEEKTGGVVVVDIGASTTTVTIFYEGVLFHSVVLPLGSDLITNDLMRHIPGLSKVQAENIKMRFGKAIPHEDQMHHYVKIDSTRTKPAKSVSHYTINSIIYHRLEEIVELVMMQLAKENMHLGTSVPHGIVLTGATARMEGMVDLVELVTGLDARIGNPFENVNLQIKEDVQGPQWSVAVGVLYQCFFSIDERDNQHLDETVLWAQNQLYNEHSKSAHPSSAAPQTVKKSTGEPAQVAATTSPDGKPQNLIKSFLNKFMVDTHAD